MVVEEAGASRVRCDRKETGPWLGELPGRAKRGEGRSSARHETPPSSEPTEAAAAGTVAVFHLGKGRWTDGHTKLALPGWPSFPTHTHTHTITPKLLQQLGLAKAELGAWNSIWVPRAPELCCLLHPQGEP